MTTPDIADDQRLAFFWPDVSDNPRGKISNIEASELIRLVAKRAEADSLSTLERQAAEIERLRGALRDIKALPDRSKNPTDAFDRGARAARLDAADMAEAALTGEDA